MHSLNRCGISKWLQLLALLLVLSHLCTGQNGPGIKTFSPPTPNAASLGKYGEIPVSLYNGIPEIAIPLYTVTARGVELPINLSYHAGGIKVEEIASWVGLGWSLNAGGVITRSIRGIADDIPSSGYFTTRALTTASALEYMNPPLNPASSLDWETPANGHAENGNEAWVEQNGVFRDPEPDMFYFNFGPYAGKFFMDKDGFFIPAPRQDLDIKVDQTPTVGATRWTITTPDGVKYIFGQSTKPDNPRTAIEKTQNTIFNNIHLSWYLVEIITPYGDGIDLFYEQEEYQYRVKECEMVNVLLDSDPNFVSDIALGAREVKVTPKYMWGVRLRRILSSSDDLTFNPGSTTRQDLLNTSYLASIQIKNSTATLNKKIDFTYSYFGSNSGGSSYYKRLRLDNIEEYAIEESPGIPPKKISGGKHVFSYNLTPLAGWDPDGISINSQDLWGFYNGQQNSVLCQSLKVETDDGIFTAQGAKRYSSEIYAVAGMLEKITYPTGGFTQFDYEANRVYASDEDFHYLNVQPVGKSDFIPIHSGEGTVEKTITIVDPDPLTGMVDMHFMVRQMVQDCPPNPNGFPRCFNVYLEGINGTYYPKALMQEGTFNFPLAPGTYKISGNADAGEEAIAGVYDKHYYFQLNWQEFPGANQISVKSNKEVGGVRIKRITDYSASGNLSIKRYDYNLFGSSTSSGVLVNFPQSYATIFRMVYRPPGRPVGFGTYLQLRSYPLSPLQPTKSSTVGYANVTEYSGEYGENGKTEYVFLTASDFPDDIKNYRPYPLPTSYDWRRGLLKMRTTFSYDKSSNIFKRIKSTENEYVFDKNSKEAYGFAYEQKSFFHSGGANDFIATDASNYYIAGYKVIGEFFYKQWERTRMYVPAGSENYLESRIDYDYGYNNGHYQLTAKTQRNSDNSTFVTNYRYPGELTLTGDEEAARLKLNENFMKAVVLEETQTKEGIQLSKTRYRYKLFNNIPLLNGTDIQTKQNPLEQRVNIDKYDNFGNITSQKKALDVNNAYVWGYKNTYPIADVTNAAETDIAYTSFETDALGNWTFSPTSPTPTLGVSRTGRMFFNLSGSISKTLLSTSSTYVVSYWSKNGGYNVNSSAAVSGPTINGWTYYEHQVVNPSAGTITITGSGAIDELRLYPKDAQMTTYTHDPAVGVTAVTDPNNIATFYEYDLLGRLKIIRDNNSKIIKTFVYHFKGE